MTERYRVEPTGCGFWPFRVVAGDGTRELFIGHRKSCDRVAAELTTAFRDGEFVGKRDYDALHAEAEALRHRIEAADEWATGATQALEKKDAEIEALRAENGRLSDAHDDMCRKAAWYAEREEKARTELEAARGLLRECHSEFDTCEASGFEVRMRQRIAAFLTSTPAPEVRHEQAIPNASNGAGCSHLQVGEQAEQRGRQEAGANFDEMELCMHKPASGGWVKVFTTPQPGPDVRGLVESIQAAVNAVNVPVTMTPAKAEYYKAGARHIIAKVNEALAVHPRRNKENSMIAEMDQSGVITIRPETGAEAFALRNWSIKAEIGQSLAQYDEHCVIKSSMLVIRHQVEDQGGPHEP